MNRLDTHPAIEDRRRSSFDRLTDSQKLAPHLRHLLQLDPNAVYSHVGGSVAVYYVSPHAKLQPGEHCMRCVLSPTGKMLRIGRVGFDPRVKVAA